VGEEWMESLNLLANGDLFHLFNDEINKLLKKNYRHTNKNNRGYRSVFAQPSRTTKTSLTKSKIGTLLEYMETNILNSLVMQLDAKKIKK
jgi:hypothetical protein